MEKVHDRHLVKVDGEETYLLSHRICDSGIALTVSGPEVILMHEHEVTELDGSQLDLAQGRKPEA